MTTPTPPGPTIYSVAAQAGVSIASVSRVFQGSAAVSSRTRRKVLEAAAALNYVPLSAARSLAVRQHEAFGLVLPELRGPYYSELLMGFESQAAELGMGIQLVLAGGGDLGDRVRDLASRVDGLAVLGATGLAEAALAALGDAKPLVVIAGQALPNTDAIRAENIDQAHRLTGHLLQHGHRRLVFLGAPDTTGDLRQRYQGFRQAHDEYGLATPEPVPVRLEEAGGIEYAEHLLGIPDRPQALFCANDEVALAVMDRLMRAGVRIPADVAVVGWDDVHAARYIRPGLTTVRQPVRLIGRLTATRLYERVGGAPVAVEPTVLPTELVLRSSCGCAEPDPLAERSDTPVPPHS